jgi:hypothetical protein
MSEVHQAVASSAYALLALQQPLTLDEIAKDAKTSSFRLARTQTPTWFAAAAEEGSSLLDTAPELLAMPDDEPVDVTGIDLIRVYAPHEAHGPKAPLETPAKVQKQPEAPAKPRTSMQIGLLKELSDLDV